MARIERTIAVLAASVAAAVSNGAASAESNQSVNNKMQLAVKNYGTSCAVTEIDHKDNTIGINQNVYSEDGHVSGPVPQRYEKNDFTTGIEQAVLKEANYTTTLDNGNKVAITFINGVCVVDLLTNEDGRIGLYENVISADGKISGPNPDFIQSDAQQKILENASGVISVNR